MKRVLQLSVVGLFAALAGLGFASTRPTVSTAAEPVAAETGFAGPYTTYCARCHGGDGRANTAKGRQLEADDLTDSSVQNMSTDKMTRIIKNGRGKMPGFKNLTARQISQIIASVRSF